jgi:hypothetical protein
VQKGDNLLDLINKIKALTDQVVCLEVPVRDDASKMSKVICFQSYDSKFLIPQAIWFYLHHSQPLSMYILRWISPIITLT